MFDATTTAQGDRLAEMAGLPLVIFGVSGPLTVEIEESCARAGRPIAALLRNRCLPARVLDRARLHDVAELGPHLHGAAFLCPLFTPANRRLAQAEAGALGLVPAPALIDPTAIRPRALDIGEGSYVNAGSILGAALSLGRFVIVNRGANIGHHARLDDFVSIGPGAVIAGEAEIGEGALIGAGAVLGPGVTIGAGAVVAPGAVLRHALPAGHIALGNPARHRRMRRG